MKPFIFIVILAVILFTQCQQPANKTEGEETKKDTASIVRIELTTPEEALAELKAGNKRFVENKLTEPDRAPERRTAVAEKQKPFAIVLGCSDSRVPAELVFDQGIGNLFIVRNAGAILDDVVLGSIEYAVEHLGSKLIVVLGHERCGAVTAATKEGEVPGHIPSIVEKIKPAVEKVKSQTGDLVVNSIHSNVALVVDSIKNSHPILKEFVEKGELKVVGAYYDLDSGEVTFTE